jgi:multisubunit Na+/H+ antiporter MnhG subunit
MWASTFLRGWLAVLESLGIAAVILTALGIMLGLTRFADGLKRIGAILVTLTMLIPLPGIVICTWSAIPRWQRVALVAIGIVVLVWFRTRSRTALNKLK